MFQSPLSDTPSARDYIDIMVDIRNLGIFNNLEEHTPTIVVFGDQSSGKSSVITRLTGGLPMPRASTKCTTTPFEIRMLQTEEPIRKITLRYIEDRNRIPIRPREIDFADIAKSSKKEIEDKLREAQRYVQNPSIRDINSRLPDQNNDELAFTKNAVCLTIGGPAQKYSLSLVDLPGIVRNNADNEKFLIDLVKEYIRRDSAILVPIFAATSDIATQCAWRLAREADPDGMRTVGALTKIDRIIDYKNDEEKQLELSNLVKGKGEHQIVNGVYVIRNRSAVEPEDSDDALENEIIKELKKDRTWKDVPFHRFGLPNLVMKLSELQGEAHKRSWPYISPLLEKSKDDFEDRLNSLPHKPVGNPTIRFLELIGKFDKAFTSHANAENVNHKLYRGQQWNFGQFDQALLNTRPKYKLTFDEENSEIFDPIKPGSLQYRAWSKELRKDLLDEWGTFGFDGHSGEPKYWTIDDLYEAVQESQGGLLAGYFPYKAVVSIVGAHQKKWLTISTKLLNKNYDWVENFTDELIKEIFNEFPNVIEEIKNVLHQLLRKCKDETLKHLKDLEEMEHISASRALYVTDEASLLKKQSKYFIKLRILAASSSQENQNLKEALDLGTKLFDMMYNEDADDDEFEEIKSDLINHISSHGDMNVTSQRLIEEIKSLRLATETPSTATISAMLTIKNSYLDRLIRIIPESEHARNHSILRNTINEHAFLAATGALAYWKMSHSKFREIVPRIVEYYLVHQFAIRLGMHLRAHFRLLGAEPTNRTDPAEHIDLDSLLGEDPVVARNRAEWQANVTALYGILDRVRKASTKKSHRNQNNNNSGGGGSGSGGGNSGGGSGGSSGRGGRNNRF